MKFILTGGGTGGHIYPALAIARGLLEKYPGSEIMFVGTSKGLEADIVPREGFDFKTITVEGLPRKLSPQVIKTGWKLLKGLVQARKIIKGFNPDIVIGTGGYVCGPVMMMSALMGFSTVIHEQNAYPGITNKILARFVDKVLVTFPESKKYFPQKTYKKVTGLPVRKEILTINRDEGIKNLNLNPGKLVVLVFGGSRGARSINTAMVDIIKAYQNRDNVQILHITGQYDYQETLTRLENQGIQLELNGDITIKPYVYNMEDALAAADVVVCRAGATTIAEINAKGIPGILIPYPYAAENHQEYNARALEKAGAAILIKDRELNSQTLKNVLDELMDNKKELIKMKNKSKGLGKPNALADIINEVAEIIFKKRFIPKK